ncbi:MAG TPA: hypothetical protein VMR21_16205 [Vicinamibacteria bacterium]|nr:hypothetical protein [Vicinamibacteria bacterium]
MAGNGYAQELERVMLRNFGISLLFFGLLAAGYDGFRQRDRAQTMTFESSGAAETPSDVHISNYGTGIPPK